MFSDIIDDLGRGRLPECNLLRRRFNLALTKKMGVVNLPYHFWVNDPKINPSSKHLLWAAVLLADAEAFAQVEAVLALEAQAARVDTACLDSTTVNILPTSPELKEFLSLASSRSFERILMSKIMKIISFKNEITP